MATYAKPVVPGARRRIKVRFNQQQGDKVI
jgi:hypothetical protein